MSEEPTERERWRRKRVLLSTLPLAGWMLFAATLVMRGPGDGSGIAGLGCIAVLVITALVLGGAAVTIAVYLSRNDPKD